MLTGRDIICVSSIDWDFVWQGHQEIMSAFARHGNRVLFIENTGVRTPQWRDLPRLRKRFWNWCTSLKGFRQVQERLWVYAPVILPFPYSRVAQWVNRWLLLTAITRWMRAMRFQRPIIWAFLPTGMTLTLIKHLEPELVLYYCIAEFETLVRHPRKVRKTERRLLERCDLVFAQGAVLRDKCRRWNRRVHVFPFGVNLEVFERESQRVSDMPDDLRRIPQPLIGYVGGLHRHVDFPLVRAVAAQRPDWSFVFVGPIQADVSSISGLPNTFLLGKKTFEQLPTYIRRFDVCTVPYAQSAYTHTVYPTKLNEYHALGKPVVSTPLPEIRAFNERHGPLVYLADGAHEFAAQIAQALRERDPERLRRRISIAQDNGWNRRIEQMSEAIEAALQEKSQQLPIGWQERLTALYRPVKRRVAGMGVALALVYLLAFHSPMLWWLASPLHRPAVLRPADAVVVFSGGVGESGKAGQGYAERVERAVELYHRGLVPELVFLSGYVYTVNETELMRTLARSLGVPESAIAVVSQGHNTVEYVRLARQLAQARGWRSIMLVSAPYHMTRSLLTFRRQAPELTVHPAAAAESAFFARSRRVKYRQWHAILHEYLGMGYYWLKRWL